MRQREHSFYFGWIGVQLKKRVKNESNIMEMNVKIILSVIGILFFLLLGLVFINDVDHGGGVMGNEQKKDPATTTRLDRFVDSSKWHVYTSDEQMYEIKYPPGWEFNLADGTIFHPEQCVHNKYEKCIGHISIGVYADADGGIDLSKKCPQPQKETLRFIRSDVWICDVSMSDEFALTHGYDRKKEYYFKDGRGNVFEIDLMYMHGADIRIEQEMIQTLKKITRS
jgi:hypothetical protein